MKLSATERVYNELSAQAIELLSVTSNPVANAANLCALLFARLSDLNWIGFYFLNGEQLVVGPFQGQPACVTIPLGKGVCGTAAKLCQTVRVADVDSFPGHIACDISTKSEIVIPVVSDGAVFAVLDVDSSIPDRFDDVDQVGLEALAKIYANSLE